MERGFGGHRDEERRRAGGERAGAGQGRHAFEGDGFGGRVRGGFSAVGGVSAKRGADVISQRPCRLPPWPRRARRCGSFRGTLGGGNGFWPGERVREGLQGSGLSILSDSGPIVPILVGEPEPALDWSRQLREAGFLVPAIRPPTVPRGTSRLRLSLSAVHSDEQINEVIERLRDGGQEGHSLGSIGPGRTREGRHSLVDWDHLRRTEFPVSESWAYFDHAAVAPLPRRSGEAMRAWLEDQERNGCVNWPQWERKLDAFRGALAS